MRLGLPQNDFFFALPAIKRSQFFAEPLVSTHRDALLAPRHPGDAVKPETWMSSSMAAGRKTGRLEKWRFRYHLMGLKKRNFNTIWFIPQDCGRGGVTGTGRGCRGTCMALCFLYTLTKGTQTSSIHPGAPSQRQTLQKTKSIRITLTPTLPPGWRW